MDDHLETAIELMERALAMMDAGGFGLTIAGCRLQLAIDIAKIERGKPRALQALDGTEPAWPMGHAGVA